MKRFLIALVLTLSTGLLTFSALPDRASVRAAKADANWPQWRGPESSGISSEKNLPVEWSTSKNLKWKAAVPRRGHSSPIVCGNKVFLTTAIEGEVVPGAKAPVHMSGNEVFVHPDSVGADRKHTFKVLCYDKETGKLLWEQTAYVGTPYDDRHRKSSFASSTPVTDGRHVYAFFGSEGLYAYDMNGKLAWKANLGKLGTVGMGTGTSPVLYENLVILQCDEEEGKASFIVALDKKSGKEVWRTARKVQASWATPILVRSGKRTELVTSGNEFIISYDPATGKELWRSKGVDSNAIPTPLAADETVFIAAGFPVKVAMAIRTGGAGEIAETNILWKYAKDTAYVPSPI